MFIALYDEYASAYPAVTPPEAYPMRRYPKTEATPISASIVKTRRLPFDKNFVPASRTLSAKIPAITGRVKQTSD